MAVWGRALICLWVFVVICSFLLAVEKLPCGSCHKLVPITAKKCPFCQAEFEEFGCPKCGKMISVTAKKCPFCGFVLEEKRDSPLQKQKKVSKASSGPSAESSTSTSSPVPDFSSRQTFLKSTLGLGETKFFYDAYFRLSARYDFGHNSKTLGWWPLYGRLLNERNWLQLGLGVELLEKKHPRAPSARLYGRIEGDSFRTADDSQGLLSRYAFTQFYLESENFPLPGYITQVGTLWYNMGYLGIYDLYAAQALWETVGIRMGRRSERGEWFVGIGDSGYEALKERRKTFPEAGYSAIPTVGLIGKLRLAQNLWLGSTFTLRYESGSRGNPNSLHTTPGLDYRDILRGDVIDQYLQANPSDPQAIYFPSPKPHSDLSWRWTAWLGFGNLSLAGLRLRWCDVSFALENKVADFARRFQSGSIVKDVYLGSYTDERYELTLASESYWIVVDGRLDLILGLWGGYAWDEDNRWRPDDANRALFSIVLRPQYYWTERVHLLLEVSFAVEKSLVGNRYRERYDSILSNTDGIPDPLGLEWGDTDTKYTLQFKGGLVFNLAGKGIYRRPSIRLLFGAQYSNVHAAFGNSYIESLSRTNYWNKRKNLRWHYILSVEIEHWFGG